MFNLLKRDDQRATIDRLYGAIVAQARAPAFYADFGVPDTVAGRFDMLVLHVHLVTRRLAAADAIARDAGQALCDRFFEDMDANLREFGVGDLSVPRKMRTLAEAYYGRAARYDAALDDPDECALVAALVRNVFESKAPAAAGERLARYVRRAEVALGRQDAGSIARGAIVFPRPEEA
jgi:cytochrome b pre-mRNA-processing protein 3